MSILPARSLYYPVQMRIKRYKISMGYFCLWLAGTHQISRSKREPQR